MGEKHYKSVLTDKKVLAIREMAANGYGAALVAERFGIKMKHASLIIRRKRWKHIP